MATIRPAGGGENGPGSDRGFWRLAGRLGWPALLAVAATLVYLRGFQGVFLYDDLRSIPGNPTIRSLTDWNALLNPPAQTTVSGRPLVNISLAINYAISGSDPWSYHLVNLLLHIGCGWLIFWLMGQILCNSLPSVGARAGRTLSGIASLFWIVHPLHVESVVYVVQRTELLSGFFYLLTLAACWRYWHRRSPAMLLLAGIGSALGMMCKESMATVPLMALLIDRQCVSVTFRQSLQRHRWLYGVLAASWLVLFWVNRHDPRGDTAGFDTGVSCWQYLMTQSQVICHYLWNAFWPSRLAILYDWPLAEHPSQVILTGISVVFLLGLTWLGLAKRRLGSLAGIWFFLLLAPTSSFIPISTEVAAERRMYLPLAALMALASVGGWWLWQRAGSCRWRRAAAWALVTMVTLAFSGVTWHQTGYFQKQSRVFEKALAFEPKGAYLQLGLGLACLEEKEPEKSLQAFAAARQIKPDLLQGYFYAASVHLAHQRPDQALELCRQALEHEPKYAPAHLVLAEAAWQKGDREQAMRHAQQALRYGASLAHVRLAVGQLLDRMGHAATGLPAAITAENLDQVIDGYETALRYSPHDPSLLADLGAALARKGMGDAAMKSLLRALKYDPALTRARLNLALLYLNRNEPAQAIVEYRRLLQQEPGSAEAHYQLAVTLARMGQIGPAIEHQRQAVELQPDRVQARLHLALLLLSLSQDQATEEAAIHAQEALRLTQGRDAMANDVLQSIRKQQKNRPAP